MKVKRRKLSKKAKQSVRDWLRNSSSEEKSNICPFEDDYRCIVCESWFPRCEITRRCPCHCYTLRTVIKKAKEMLES